MARPAKLWRVIMFGRLYGLQDWSTGYWIQGGADATDPTPAEMQLSLQSIWALASAPYTGFRPLNFTTSTVDGLRGYWYSSAGGPATSVGDYAPAGGSTGTGTTRQPPLASIVMSLQTGRAGRSYRGRMYMPISGCPALASNGEVPTAQVDALATATQNHFNACNAIDWSGSWLKSGTIVVASDTKGVSTPVTSVEIDSIVDTQHRRSNDFSATYRKEVAITI